jgi:tetratricopeptide (TPR) repeat protein
MRTALLTLLMLLMLPQLAGEVMAQTSEAAPGVQEAGTAQRKERNASMSETAYRRLSTIQDLMGDGNLDEALKRLQSMEKTNLTDYEEALVFQTYGFVYAQQGNYQAAIDAFERCLELDALPNIGQQGMLYSLAGLYASESLHQKTIQTMSTWLKYAQEPVPGDAYMLIGSAYAELKQLDKALPYVIEAIKRADKPRENWYQLALSIYFDRDDYGAGRDLLKQMVVLWPDTPRYWEMLSSVYMELKDDRNALATMMVAYQKGLLVKEAKLVNLAKLNMYLEIPFAAGRILDEGMASGRIEANVKNLELLLSAWSAAREFDRAIGIIDRLGPLAENGEYFVQKAQLLYEKSDWPQVIIAADRALELGGLKRPGSVYVLKGMAQAEQGDYDDALGTLEQARQFDDNARRNANSWINYVQDRRQVALARP